MAKKPTTSTTNQIHSSKQKSKRPGVHSKKKASVSKNSKNYLKRNNGQGR